MIPFRTVVALFLRWAPSIDATHLFMEPMVFVQADTPKCECKQPQSHNTTNNNDENNNNKYWIIINALALLSTYITFSNVINSGWYSGKHDILSGITKRNQIAKKHTGQWYWLVAAILILRVLAWNKAMGAINRCVASMDGAHGKSRAVTALKGILSGCLMVICHDESLLMLHDDLPWSMMAHDDESSWFIVMNHQGESVWYIMMTQHDDEPSWSIMMSHHDASRYFIMMNRDGSS